MRHIKFFTYMFVIGIVFIFLNTTFASDRLEVKREIWQSNNLFEESAGTYSISNDDCTVTWKIIEFKNKETGNYYDLKHISSCSGTFFQQRHLHDKILHHIVSEWDEKKFKSIHVHGLRRLEPSGIWNDRIANTSAASADWIDWQKNYPHHSSGKSINGIFVQVANSSNAYKEFSDLFNELGYSIKIKSVEKVESTKTKPRLLYDAAIIYFSMDKIEKE